MNNLDSVSDNDFDSIYIINESDLNHVNSNINFDFKQKIKLLLRKFRQKQR